MTIIKEINLAIYPVSVFVVCSDVYTDILPKINSHFKRNHANAEPFTNIHIPDQDRCSAFVISSGTIIYLVLPFNEEETNRHSQLQHIPTLNNIIPHEALHVTSIIMDLVGIRFDRHNDEPIAYLIGHISGQTTSVFLAFLHNLEVEVTL